MTREDPRPLRVLLRSRDGRLLDLEDGGRDVTLEEFRARLQTGERLRVRHETTGGDCTLDLLLQLVATCLPKEGGLLGLLGDGGTR
ncbi:hypothetical protein [Streptomyces beijiangensis]|uniref:Uncharacterized protein n=1 Tax=Streptomyces beijiangensis TaxID=163361 RepID=A0A939JGR3_9ACTN|nr:hypothetical protein [Streptomyces beijiangensis]MBO0511370.1 hypothetical protein [Streptomyces beijiangensis]